MSRMGKLLMFVLLFALCLPSWAAGAQTLSTQQKFEALKEKGIFTGFSDGSSRLNDPMTREQFAAVLFRLWGMEETRPAKATYSDVLKTRWSYAEVEAVSKAGLMQGTGNGKFSPVTPVTVEQLAAVLVRAYGYEGTGSTPVTGKASLWARGSVSIALDHNFIPVQADYTANATRALLVEAAYAVDQENGGKLDVSSVQPLSNTTLLVTLNKAVKAADVSRFSLRNAQGGSIAILQTTLSIDGKSVTVLTGPQSASVVHTLFIDGTAWRYTAVSDSSSGGSSEINRPRIVSVTNLGNQTIKLTFSKTLNRSTAEDPDNYEVTRGDLDLLSFELSDDRKSVVIATSEQEDGYSYRLTVRGVKDSSGYSMATRTDVTFKGVDDNSKPTVKSVTNLGNNTLKVVFSEKINVNDARDTDNYLLDNGLYVYRATVASDGLTVTLYTNAQEDGQEYKLTIRRIADLSGNELDTKSFAFTGGTDRTKPTVVSVSVQGNSSVLVQFSEKVNVSQATNKSNYSIDNGLSVLSAVIADGGKAVELTTSKQKDAVLYNLTVKGIADLSGNVMDKQSNLWFGGVVDNTPPTVTGIAAASKQIVLTFSERLNSASATRTSNYKLDGGLSVQSAKYDDAKRTVTLATSAQTPGAVYTLTINQVIDLSGLSIQSNTRLQFVGAGSDTAASIALQSLSAVDQNTVQATFSRALYDADIAKLKLAIIKDNGANLSNEGWSSYVSRKPGTDNVVIVQFRTEKEANPTLFKSGRVYIGRVTGIDGLLTDKGANEKPFAGTEKANKAPYAVAAAAVNDQAVKVTFSEPVRNVSPAGFVILREDGSSVPIRSDSVGDPGRVVTEAVLYADDELKAGQTYWLQFRSSVTDAAGWNAIQTKDGSHTYELSFKGTSAVNQAPRIDRVTSKDRYTFEVKFTKPVRIGDPKGFTLYNESDRDSEINIDKNGYAVYVQSDDRTALTVYLNANKEQTLQSGKRYRLEYDSREGQITDDLGEALRGTSDTIEAVFTSNGAANARPSISKVEARGSAILITFSEPITGYTNQTDFFDIEIGGRSVKPTSGSLQGRTVALSVPALTSGQIGKLHISSEGAKAIRDYNQQSPETDDVAFGVQ